MALTPVQATSFDGIDALENSNPRCPVAVLVDTSASMHGAPLIAAAQGLQQFYRELAADLQAALRCEPMTITFGGEVKVVLPFGQSVDTTAATPPRLVAQGGTPLGQAVTRAISEIETRREAYRRNNLNSYRPWVVIISDGQPTDPDWESAAEQLQRRAVEQKWNVLCIAVGPQARIEPLQKFCRLPVKHLAGLKFGELFAWLSDSLSAVSRSSTSASAVKVPSTKEWEFNP